MKKASALRRTVSLAKCLVMLLAAGSLTATAKDMSVNALLAFEKQDEQVSDVERRLCRYEHHECQLLSEVFVRFP